jgi:hypothetical protein
VIARRSKLRPIPPSPPRPRRVDGPGWYLDSPGREPDPAPVVMGELTRVLRALVLLGGGLILLAIGGVVGRLGCHREPPPGPLVPVNRSPVPADRPEPPLELDGREVTP